MSERTSVFKITLFNITDLTRRLDWLPSEGKALFLEHNVQAFLTAAGSFYFLEHSSMFALNFST